LSSGRITAPQPSYDILLKDASHVEHNMCVTFATETENLPKAWDREDGRRPMGVDTIWEKD